MLPRLRFLAHSLEFRLLMPLAATIGLVLAVHALLGYWTARGQVAQFVRADLERSSALIQSATEDGMLLNRRDEVQARIERLGASPGFAGIRVYAKDGRVAFSADPVERDRLVPLTADACVVCHVASQQTGPGVLRSSELVKAHNGHESQRFVSVIRNKPSCSAAHCHASPERHPVLGVLEVEMTMAPFDEAVSRARAQLAWTTAILILASGSVAALFIRRLIHDPVTRLREGARRIAMGDLSTRIDVPGKHDLAALAGAFNSMAADLGNAREQLDAWSRTLEQRIQEKTLALQDAQKQMTQVETMASLGKLSATVAHELNNPLSGILTYVRLVRRDLAEQPIDPAARPEIESALALVDKECVRCGDIVRNLLVFARGRGVRLAPADLNQIVEHTTKLVRHHLELHKVRLESTPLPGDPIVIADQGQLHQAMLALLMNAIEAMHGMPDRPAVLGVHLDGDESVVRIRVSDTGKGIPPEALPHIFKPFFTTKGETSGVGGVGLGLSVVYGVVHAHGGDIAVQSRRGAGTTFTITLLRRRDVLAPTAHEQGEKEPEIKP